jgi:hypothetical protein
VRARGPGIPSAARPCAAPGGSIPFQRVSGSCSALLALGDGARPDSSGTHVHPIECDQNVSTEYHLFSLL